jgi:hypothetical protein
VPRRTGHEFSFEVLPGTLGGGPRLGRFQPPWPGSARLGRAESARARSGRRRSGARLPSLTDESGEPDERAMIAVPPRQVMEDDVIG